MGTISDEALSDRFAATARAAAGLVSVTAVVAVILQYPDFVVGKSLVDAAASTIDFFSMFTIQTNLLVAFLAGAYALRRGERFWRPEVTGAAATYIVIVGAIYLALLSSVYHPEGITLIAIILLHYVVPPAFFALWLVAVPKGALGFDVVAYWLIYPLAFAAYTFVHGLLTDWYPYPFLDVAKLGYVRVVTTSLLMIAGFGAVGLLFVGLDRVMGGWRSGRRATPNDTARG